MFRRPAWLCLHSASCVVTQQNTTFLGVAHPGRAYDPKFELDLDLCAMHLPHKFHHPRFTSLEVIVLTNKQTNRFGRKYPMFFATLWGWVIMTENHVNWPQAHTRITCGTPHKSFHTRDKEQPWNQPATIILFSQHNRQIWTTEFSKLINTQEKVGKVVNSELGVKHTVKMLM